MTWRRRKRGVKPICSSWFFFGKVYLDDFYVMCRMWDERGMSATFIYWDEATVRAATWGGRELVPPKGFKEIERFVNDRVISHKLALDRFTFFWQLKDLDGVGFGDSDIVVLDFKGGILEARTLRTREGATTASWSTNRRSDEREG